MEKLGFRMVISGQKSVKTLPQSVNGFNNGLRNPLAWYENQLNGWKSVITDQRISVERMVIR